MKNYKILHKVLWKTNVKARRLCVRLQKVINSLWIFKSTGWDLLKNLWISLGMTKMRKFNFICYPLVENNPKKFFVIFGGIWYYIRVIVLQDTNLCVFRVSTQINGGKHDN